MKPEHVDNPMGEKRLPLVSVIIPHWRGKGILIRCLISLKNASLDRSEILLIDNGSTDGSVDEAVKTFPSVSVLKSETNLGYAGGCNLGIENARGEFALLLNDDAEVTPGFLDPLVECMAADRTVAACQPKICSIRQPGRFDYAGAAGGYLDIFGFPFCRGRIFVHVEDDHGQYDDPREIFWASGACCLVRMSALREVGNLDEDFFAHMEEIDLQWRMRRAGYKIMSVPSSIVRHEAGSTLGAENPYKIYLNHRNSLIMMLKNHSAGALLAVLPVRIALDIAAMAYRLLRGEVLNASAILHALGYSLFHLSSVLRRRNQHGSSPTMKNARLYKRSIVWDYFILRQRRFSDLPFFFGQKHG